MLKAKYRRRIIRQALLPLFLNLVLRLGDTEINPLSVSSSKVEEESALIKLRLTP